MKETPQEESFWTILWKAAKSPLQAFTASKKFKALVISIVSIIATWLIGLISMKFGVEISPEQLQGGIDSVSQWIVALTATYIGGQAVSDATKEKAAAQKESSAEKGTTA